MSGPGPRVWALRPRPGEKPARRAPVALARSDDAVKPGTRTPDPEVPEPESALAYRSATERSSTAKGQSYSGFRVVSMETLEDMRPSRRARCAD